MLGRLGDDPEVVRDQNDRCAHLPFELQDQVEDLRLDRNVEGRCGLVGNDEGRFERERQRERGYNQAELIARPLARRLNRPISTDVLRRLHPRPPKLKLSRRERWETVRGAFEVPAAARVDRSCILLVDDVLTSGATLDACARALRSAGAAAVHAVTVARVLPRWLAAVGGTTL